MTTVTTAEREAIDAAVAAGNVTKVKAGRARGVNKRTAPMTATKATRAQRGKVKATRAQRGKVKATRAQRGKATANTSRPKGTFTSVDIANEHGVNAKTLRARIRRNIGDWEPLFVDGQRHVFKDNKTTRAKIAALMA